MSGRQRRRRALGGGQEDIGCARMARGPSGCSWPQGERGKETGGYLLLLFFFFFFKLSVDSYLARGEMVFDDLCVMATCLSGMYRLLILYTITL
jgi:hypothetical protein